MAVFFLLGSILFTTGSGLWIVDWQHEYQVKKKKGGRGEGEGEGKGEGKNGEGGREEGGGQVGQEVPLSKSYLSSPFPLFSPLSFRLILM